MAFVSAWNGDVSQTYALIKYPRTYGYAERASLNARLQEKTHLNST